MIASIRGAGTVAFLIAGAIGVSRIVGVGPRTPSAKLFESDLMAEPSAPG